MRKVLLLLTCSFLFCSHLGVGAQKGETPNPPEQNNSATTEREIREFLDSYADDLCQHRREAIADRYDPRGVFFLGNGRKTLKSFEAVKNSYQTTWTGPKSFEWKDITVEVLSRDAAVVIGRFEWASSSEKIATFSYTSLLIKHGEKWHIRVEDESNLPGKAPAQ